MLTTVNTRVESPVSGRQRFAAQPATAGKCHGKFREGGAAPSRSGSTSIPTKIMTIINQHVGGKATCPFAANASTTAASRRSAPTWPQPRTHYPTPRPGARAATTARNQSRAAANPHHPTSAQASSSVYYHLPVVVSVYPQPRRNTDSKQDRPERPPNSSSPHTSTTAEHGHNSITSGHQCYPRPWHQPTVYPAGPHDSSVAVTLNIATRPTSVAPLSISGMNPNQSGRLRNV